MTSYLLIEIIMIYLRIYKELLSTSNYITMPIKKRKPKKSKKEKVPKKDKKKRELVENNITINVGSGSGGGGGKGGKSGGGGGRSSGGGGRRGNTGGGKSGKDGTSNVVSGVSTGGLNGPDNAGYLAPTVQRYREPQPYSQVYKKEDNNELITKITGLLTNGQYNNKLVNDRLDKVETDTNTNNKLLTSGHEKVDALMNNGVWENIDEEDLKIDKVKSVKPPKGKVSRAGYMKEYRAKRKALIDQNVDLPNLDLVYPENVAVKNESVAVGRMPENDFKPSLVEQETKPTINIENTSKLDSTVEHNEAYKNSGKKPIGDLKDDTVWEEDEEVKPKTKKSNAERQREYRERKKALVPSENFALINIENTSTLFKDSLDVPPALGRTSDIPVFNATTKLKPEQTPFTPKVNLPRKAKTKAIEKIKDWVDELNEDYDTPLKKAPKSKPSSLLSSGKVHVENFLLNNYNDDYNDNEKLSDDDDNNINF
jgi:hypothetical protein